MFDQTLVIVVTAIGLAIWIVGPLAAIAWPTRHHDPQRGQAVGCLMIVALSGLLPLGMFVIGLLADVQWMVRVPYSICAFFLILIVVNLFAWLVRSQRAARR